MCERLQVRLLPATAALLLPLVAAAPAAADIGDYLGQPVGSIRIQIEGRPAADERLRRLLQIQEGSPLTMLAVRESLAHLFSLGEFEDVQVDASSRGAGVDLLFELAPLHPVTRVVFGGLTAVAGADEGRLRSAVVGRFGASPSPGRAQDIARFVEAEFARRGYLHARVTPRLELEHAPDRATLILDVQPGARTVVGAVEVLGAPGIPEKELLARLGITPGSAYQPEVLAARIENYLSDRRERGFYEARLAALPRFADEDRRVNLSLDAVEGPRVRIVFTGEQLPGDVRDQLVPIAREGSTDEDLLEDSTNRIRDYLHAQGYRDAKVSHQRTQNDGELVVGFAIDRGQRYRLASVAFEGNQFLPTDALLPFVHVVVGQPFDGARLSADVSTLQELYRRRGFASAEVDAAVERVAGGAEGDVSLSIRIVIVEHAQTIVESVRVEGNTAVSEIELLAGLGLRQGGEFFATQMAVDRDAIQARYANLGFLHATVEAEPGLGTDGRRADVVFRVREGPQIFVEHVLLVGNRRTRAETIERELQVKAGDAMGQDAVVEAQRRLTALGLFRRTRIAQLSHGDENRRDLLVTVEEAAPTTVGYGGGFEVGPGIHELPDGSAIEELEFAPRAFFEITRRNLFGKNRSINLFTRISLRPQDETTGSTFTEYRVLGTFREPRVFNLAADAFLTAVVEQQHRSSFNFARRGFNAEIGRRFTNAFSLLGSYQIQETELFDEKIAEEDQPLIDRLFPQILLSSFSGSAIHDTRNDQLNPSNGHYLSANGQVAAKAIGSRVGLLKSYYTAQAFRIVPRTDRIVFAGSTRLGVATAFAREQAGVQLPASERFFAGGDTTVRGFALDSLGTPEVISDGFPVGGNGVIILNAELRVPLMRSLGVVGFLDAGNVFKQATDIDLGRLRSAAGFGLRFQSPVGPIRVDLGFKIKRQEITPGRLEEPNAWHISLGQAF